MIHTNNKEKHQPLGIVLAKIVVTIQQHCTPMMFHQATTQILGYQSVVATHWITPHHPRFGVNF